MMTTIINSDEKLKITKDSKTDKSLDKGTKDSQNNPIIEDNYSEDIIEGIIQNS